MDTIAPRESSELHAQTASSLLPQEKQREAVKESSKAKPAVSPELLALIRLIIREPPADHDFGTCPICKHYGIKSI
jgi:hypothetical protein